MESRFHKHTLLVPTGAAEKRKEQRRAGGDERAVTAWNHGFAIQVMSFGLPQECIYNTDI